MARVVHTFESSALCHGVIACVSAGFVIFAETRGVATAYLLGSLPLTILLVLWSGYVLCRGIDRVTQLFVPPYVFISLPVMLFLLLLTCSPVIQFSHLHNHPFNDTHWLIVSANGVLFSLAFLNCSFARNAVCPARTLSLFEKLCRLPAPFFLCAAVSWVLLAASCFSATVFDNVPHVQDSIAQLFQAKIFARGSLTAPVPPLPEFFQYPYDNLIMTDRWYSQYPPGHPLLLMLGLMLKAPWIINPLVAALTVMLLYSCALHFFGEHEARLSVILFCVSPFVLFMSASFMNHVSTLFFLLLCLCCLNKAHTQNSIFYAVIAGLSLGFMLNIRTGEGLALGVPIGICFLICCVRQRTYGTYCFFILSLTTMAAALLAYNYATNGDPFIFGYQVRWGKEHTIGFTEIAILNRPPHTPLRGVLHTLRNMVVLNQNLFEWPLPSFLPLGLYCLPFLFKKSRNDYLFLCGLLAAPVFYFFYFYQDLCLGARFYYVSLPFIFILTARSIINIIEMFALSKACAPQKIKNTFLNLFLICLLFAAVLRVPRLYRYYSDAFWDVDDAMMLKVNEMAIDNALVFLKHYKKHENDLGSGFLHNSPWLDGPVVFAKDTGEHNRELLPFFPGRKYYVASRNGRGEVVIEPLKGGPFLSAQ